MSSPREASQSEMEGSSYSASSLSEAQSTRPSDQTISAWRDAVADAASQDSLLGDEVKSQATTGMSTPQPTHVPQSIEPIRRMPLVIRRFGPPREIEDDPHIMEEYTFDFLQSNLGGQFRSPGYYHNTEKGFIYPNIWYAIETEHEPFLPRDPGHHGAKLTLLMPEPRTDNFNPGNGFRLFVKRGSGGYVYYGEYNQSRYSDRLSYAEMERKVPKSVKEHHAKEMGKKDKPKWIVEALKREGVVKTDEEAQSFGPADILQAFERADTDFGLRLYWEYFEFVLYNSAFSARLAGGKAYEEASKTKTERINRATPDSCTK